MGKLRVSRIENASTTDGGIDIDTSGHVQVDGLQMPTAGPLSNRNLVINGAMNVAQRETTVSSVTDSGYRTCDRFQISVSSLGTWTITQSSDSPDGFSNSLKLACTTADTSPASSDSLFIKYSFEAQDLQHLKYGTSSAETMTLSFWVKSNKTGDASIDLRQSDNSNKLYTLGYNISAANTWEQKVLTITGDTAGVINNDNGIGLEIDWWLNSGSTFTGGAGPSNSWFASDETRRNFDNFGLGGSTDDVFYITGVQLEVGEKATPFEYRSFGDELARCQRYFQKSYNQDVAPGTSTSVGRHTYYGSSDNGGNIVFHIDLAVVMRATPTVTWYTGGGTQGSWESSRSGSSGTQSVTTYRAGMSSINGFCTMGGSASSFAVGNADGHFTASAEL